MLDREASGHVMLPALWARMIWPGAVAAYGALVCAVAAFVVRFAFDWGHIDDFLLIDWHQQAFVRHAMSFGQFLTIADNSHLLAAEALASWGLFAIFGLHFQVLVYVSAALLLAGSLLLTGLLWPGRTTPSGRALALLLPLLTLCHPVQVDQLLWAFEIGWFMVDFWLIANLFLLERYGQRGLPWVAAICVLASFSSAHGNFLWLAAALHVMLRPGLRHRGAWCVGLGAGFLAGGLAIAMFTAPEAGGIRHGGLGVADSWAILTYFVDLIGSVFGWRDPAALAALGASMIALAVWCGGQAWRRPALRPGERAGFVLIFFAMLATAAFAAARFRFGLPWALAEYHAGPLPVPLLCGICLLAIEAFDDAAPGRLAARGVALLPAAFVLASVATFLPRAPSQGREQMVSRGLAMLKSCYAGASPLLVARLNGLQNEAALMQRTLPVARRLCTASVPGIVRRYATEPALFVALSAAQPDAAPALRDLWETYLAHLDLRRALPIDAPRMPRDLLAFARADALAGSPYDPQTLTGDRPILAALRLPP